MSAKLPHHRKAPRGINKAKKDKIVKNLASRMPANRRSFWEGMADCEASGDLLSSE